MLVKPAEKKNLEDIFLRALDTSDPIISSINLNGRIQNHLKLPLSSEVISLLTEMPFNSSQHQYSESEEGSESDDDYDEQLPTRT